MQTHRAFPRTVRGKEDPRITVSARLEPDLADAICALAFLKGVTVGTLLEDLIRHKTRVRDVAQGITGGTRVKVRRRPIAPTSGTKKATGNGTAKRRAEMWQWSKDDSPTRSPFALPG